nr:restriction endonuclease subunit S [uncultured Rhodoferax sp.]
MLLSNLNLLATAPGGVARLRELILTLAVQGKLVPQDPSDEPASELLKMIRAEKDRLIAEGKIKRDKLLAEIGDEEKPFELPAGWEWVHLAALAEQITKGTTPTTFGHSYTSEGVNFVKIENLDRGRLNLAQMTDFISPQTHEIMSRSQLSAGDVLFSIAGTIGKTAVVLDDDLPANTNQALAIIKGAAKHVNQRFLLLALDSFVSNKVKDKARGGAMNNISLGDLSELLMTIPPLAEQSRIVTRVEELMRLCDALEAKGQREATQHAQLVSTLLDTLTDSETPAQLADNWHRIATHFDLLLDRPEAVDALEQTILQLAVRGLLVPQDPKDEPASELLQKIRAEKDKLILEGKIKRDKPLPPIPEDEQQFALPSGWEWTQTGQLVNDSEAGWSPTCIGSPRRSGHWGVLKVSAVSWGAFDANANKELPADLAPRPEYEVQDGDFLLSRANTEELVARSVVVGTTEPKLMLSDKIIRLEVSSLMNRDFLNLCNNANHARVHYIANASGTSSSMKNVSREVVLRTPIPLPPRAEQFRIVTRVAQLRRLCADLRQRLSASQSTQAHLAEALVQEVA